MEAIDFMARFKQWKSAVWQGCPGMHKIQGGPRFCLVGGFTCSFLHCPRNIYRMPEPPIESSKPSAPVTQEKKKAEGPLET